MHRNVQRSEIHVTRNFCQPHDYLKAAMRALFIRQGQINPLIASRGRVESKGRCAMLYNLSFIAQLCWHLLMRLLKHLLCYFEKKKKLSNK